LCTNSAYNRPMHYEWDDAKRVLNLRKHGVDLADAAGVLDDPAALTVEDDMAEGEMRCITLGCDVLGRVLYVVWTQRDGHTIRLISARKASPGEARQYRE